MMNVSITHSKIIHLAIYTIYMFIIYVNFDHLLFWNHMFNVEFMIGLVHDIRRESI